MLTHGGEVLLVDDVVLKIGLTRGEFFGDEDLYESSGPQGTLNRPSAA